jgi:hypothetical protein
LTTDEAVRIAELVSALDLRTWDESRVLHWAGILQRGALASSLPGDLMLLTCEELLREVEACEVSPAKLLKRAKENPPKAWLNARKRLAGPQDAFPPIYFPKDYVPLVSLSERKRMDKSYAGWRNSATAKAMLAAQRSEVRSGGKIWRDDKKKRKKLGVDFNRGGEGPLGSFR